MNQFCFGGGGTARKVMAKMIRDLVTSMKFITKRICIVKNEAGSFYTTSKKS